MDWISKNTVYPKIIVHHNEQDTVYVSFVVEKDGSVSNIEVIKSVNNYLDREAKWVISKMPKWQPGMQNGKTVSVVCSAPIRFLLFDVNTLNMQRGQADHQNKHIDTMYTKFHIRIIQEKPQFKGDVNKWLGDHMEYPSKAKDANIQGTVYISFIVEKDGSISSVYILRGVNKYLNDEAFRVVSSMPNWRPGKIMGQPVRVQYMLPIHFELR